jgi:hypothetical protein
MGGVWASPRQTGPAWGMTMHLPSTRTRYALGAAACRTAPFAVWSKLCLLRVDSWAVQPQTRRSETSGLSPVSASWEGVSARLACDEQ